MTMNNRKGSLFIEIAIAVAALGILLAVVMPKYADTVPTAKKSADMVQISAIASAVANYKLEKKQYPTNLQVLTKKSGDLGPWMPSLPAADTWGHTTTINGSEGGASPYCYAYTSNGFAVWSMGKDGKNNSGGGGSILPVKFSGDDYGILEK